MAHGPELLPVEASPGNPRARGEHATYWIVDLDARLVEVWTPEADRPDIADQKLSWQPEAALQPLTVTLDEYFGVVRGEAES